MFFRGEVQPWPGRGSFCGGTSRERVRDVDLVSSNGKMTRRTSHTYRAKGVSGQKRFRKGARGGECVSSKANQETEEDVSWDCDSQERFLLYSGDARSHAPLPTQPTALSTIDGRHVLLGIHLP
jgi:hypothetical protein